MIQDFSSDPEQRDLQLEAKAHIEVQRLVDLDRGDLTMAGLIQFCEFFLSVCIDQVEFMARLLEPNQLLNRIEAYSAIAIRDRLLLPGSFEVLKAAFIEGEIPRSAVGKLTGYQERQARSVLKRLLEANLLVASSPKGPVRLGFPVVAVEQWLPRLWVD